MGFPFGAVLTFDYEKNKKVSLIDGLQRISTIIDFEEHPENYIDTEEETEQLYEVIKSRFTEKEKNDSNFTSQIKKRLQDKIKETLAFKGNEPLYLSQKVEEDEILKKYYEDSMLKRIINLQSALRNKKETFLRVDQILIPTIEFLGDIGELSTVFENINRGGKKLTKYQVFAAQWYNDVIQLNDKKYNKRILEEVIHRYISLNDNRDIEIENFSADKMREEGSINLSELCYAIGKLIIDVSPVFYGDKKNTEDLADELGYSALGIILGIDNRKLYSIQSHLELIKNNDFIEDLVSNMLKVFTSINNHFEKYLALPKQDKKYENKKISNFKFLSYFADLWSKNFKILPDKTIKDNSNGKDNTYSTTLNNLIYYYILDATKETWGNAGDARLNSYYLDSRTYLKRPSEKDFRDALIYWWEDRSSAPSIQFDDISKLILTVEYNLRSIKFPDGRDYEYEHVIARKRIKDKYRELSIPGGSLGNIMFLDGSINKAKKELNLYKLVNVTGGISESFVADNFYPIIEELEEAEIELNNDEASTTVKIIKERGTSIIESLIEKMYS